MAVLNPPESKLAKRTSVHCLFMDLNFKAELEMACFNDIQILIETVS